MRTAEEILLKNISQRQTLSFHSGQRIYDEVINAINEARKEVIKECANRCYIADNNFHSVITKEEIIKLINEIK